MKYLNRFSKFFNRIGNKKKEKIPFERILINLQKFIDSICPEEVVIHKPDDFTTSIKINDVKVQDDRYQTNKVPQSLGFSRIRITLYQDDNNHILITIPYNDEMKFDMLYWSEFLLINGISISKPRCRLDGIKDKIRDYLENNNLVGPVDEEMKLFDRGF